MSDGTYRGWWIDQVFRTPQISDAVRVALLALAADMDAAGRVSLPRNALAKRLGRSERRITDRLKAGIEAGFLQRATRGQKGRTAVYQAVTPAHLSGTPGCPPDGFQGDGLQHPEAEFQGDGLQHPEEAQRDPRVSSRGRFSETPGGPTTYKANADISDHAPDAVVVDLFDEEKTTSLRSKKTPARKRAEPAEDPNFDRFWQAYPKRVAKPAAMKAWKAAMKRKADPEQVILAARRYATDPQRREADSKYTAHPATWLNQERYADEPAPSKTAASGRSVRDEWKYQR